MNFILSKLAETALRPSTLILAAALFGFLLLLARATRPGLALLTASLAIQTLLFLLPIDQWLLAPLENRFPPLRPLPAQITGIIALGGAVDPAMTEARGIPSLNGAAERMTTFVALALHYPDARLAFTGGSGRIINGRLTEADVAQRLFDELGLARRPITYENRSRTTWENARDLAAIIHPAPDSRWILLTSAAHMPRAVGAFREAGWPVIPDPVGYKTADTLEVQLGETFPTRLLRLDEAAHEWLGLLVYRLLGHTPRLLPSPDARPSTRTD